LGLSWGSRSGFGFKVRVRVRVRASVPARVLLKAGAAEGEVELLGG
jgi:hypothetical protein